MIAHSCTDNENQVNYNFDTYLTANSSFEKNIATVMPSKEDLINTKVLYYIYYNGDNEGIFRNTMLRLTVEYSDEDFAKAVQTMKVHWESHHGMQFYYNGILYDGFMFHNHGDYCGIAYHICTDLNTISYIAFVNDELSYMNVADALIYCLNYLPAFEEQIVYEDMWPDK